MHDQEVKVGDTLTNNGNEDYTLIWINKPHKPSSTGSVDVRDEDGDYHTYFPSVFNLRWVGRTDQ